MRKLNKSGMMDDLFDFLFTVIAAFFILFFVSMALGGGAARAEKRSVEEIDELNSNYELLNYLKSTATVEGTELNMMDLISLSAKEVCIPHGKYFGFYLADIEDKGGKVTLAFSRTYCLKEPHYSKILIEKTKEIFEKRGKSYYLEIYYPGKDCPILTPRFKSVSKVKAYLCERKGKWLLTGKGIKASTTFPSGEDKEIKIQLFLEK